MNLDLIRYQELETITTYEGRLYVTPNGDQYPSVTTVLGRKPKPELDAWRERVGEDEARRQGKQSSLIGNALHEQCEYYLLNKERPPCRTIPRWMFNSIRPTLNEIEVVRGVEVPLWSDYLKVAGRTDCIGDFRGLLSIIDFKNSKKQKELRFVEDYFLQATTYALMFMERYRTPVKQLVVIVATWDGTPQVFVEPVQKRVQAVYDTMRTYNDLW